MRIDGERRKGYAFVDRTSERKRRRRRRGVIVLVAIALAAVGGAIQLASAASDPPSTYAGTRMTAQQAAQYAYAAGFRSENQLLAVVGIGIAESGLVTQTRNWHPEFGYRPASDVIGVQGPSAAWSGGRQMHSDRGAWQISSRWWPQYSDAQTDNPATALKLMFSISRNGTNFNDWNTYTSGSAQQYYDSARGSWPALRPIVRQVIAAGGGGTPPPASSPPPANPSSTPAPNPPSNPPSSAPSAPAVGGPAGEWHLDETSGTTAANAVTSSGAGEYRGVTLGVPGLLAKASNRAARFSGSNSQVRVASSSALSPTASVSLEAWIKPAALPAAGRFASVVTKAESYSMQFNGPRLEFTIMQNGMRRRLQAAAGAVAVGGTYHVVGTYDGATQRLYVNGTQVASSALSGAITTTTNSLFIGSWNSGSEFFAGTIDEVSVYRGVLTAAQVANRRAAGLKP
jgi:hypothetical protein